MPMVTSIHAKLQFLVVNSTCILLCVPASLTFHLDVEQAGRSKLWFVLTLLSDSSHRDGQHQTNISLLIHLFPSCPFSLISSSLGSASVRNQPCPVLPITSPAPSCLVLSYLLLIQQKPHDCFTSFLSSFLQSVF